MEPSGSNLGQAGQCHFRLLFEECCKEEVEKGRGVGGGGRGGGGGGGEVDTTILCYKEIRSLKK